MLRQKAKVKNQSNIKCTEKTIVNRQERNISQIANVQRKLQSIDKKETLAKQQMYRENYSQTDGQKDRPANTR